MDNSGDEVDIKALVRRHGRDGLVTTEVTAESALTGAHSYTFRGASADPPVYRAFLLCSDLCSCAAEDSSGNVAECSAPIGLW